MAVKDMATKLMSPAVRRDPLRMLSRPILRHLELRLVGGGLDQARRRREIGMGSVVDYQVRDLLHRSRYLYGMPEFVTASAFVSSIPAGSVVLDVGANRGEYTVLAARATEGHGRVIAYEPNPIVRTKLVQTVNANELGNVEVCPSALGSEDGPGVLKVPGDDSGLGTLRPEAVGTEFRVDVRRLDGLLSRHDRARLAAIKLDVEGFELQVLKGAQDVIAESRPAIFYECADETFVESGGRMLTPTMALLESADYINFVITMSKRGRWALKPARNVDPRKYREPWAVLMVVGIHRDKLSDSHLSGVSSLKSCGTFERLGC